MYIEYLLIQRIPPKISIAQLAGASKKCTGKRPVSAVLNGVMRRSVTMSASRQRDTVLHRSVSPNLNRQHQQLQYENGNVS